MITKKGALELSVNFFVILIISLVVFGMGITLAYKLLHKAQEEVDAMDTITQQAIDQTLTTGQSVAVGINKADVKRGRFYAFGVGVRNNECDDGSGSGTFRITVEFSAAVSPDGGTITDYGSTDPNKWTIDEKELEISLNDKRYSVIPMNPANDATRGTYIFNVKVTCGSDDWLQKIYVNVI